MLLSYYMILSILEPFISFSMSHNHVTCVTIIHDITLHPLPKSKIKKSKSKNQNKINRKIKIKIKEKENK